MVNPKLLVTLGNTPLKALYDKKAVIGEVHGQFLQLEGRTLYPMYHPASIIYNRSLEPMYREDVLRLKQWREEND